MTIQISTFNFNSIPVRIHTINNEVFFCLLDVASILGLGNRSISKFNFNPKGVEKLSTPTNGGIQEVVFINEPNLYRVIFRSNKAEAIDFQNWVFEEVLPQIRKTGQYSQKSTEIAPLAEAVQTDEKALEVIVNLFHALNQAYEMGEKLRKDCTYLAKEIDKQVGGHYLYNLNMPTKTALQKARTFVQAKSERIMFVRGMLSLLDSPMPHA